ncbi:MAG: CDP-diacylglycerol--glycerol-3-phosphate 3-phosphatidyltransferase [Aquificae bacterium]|nr:CDP-diacylglycerol--glycerol-3-phosphate 3-phosphatidyltransferase [Aquificota bacterium]
MRGEHLLTLTRVLLSFPVSFLILSENYTPAFFLYVLGALTDWFDGNIARRSGSSSELGKLLDPYADKVFVLLPLVALLDRERVGGLLVILLVFRELSISFLRSVAVERGVVLDASLLGKAKAFTEFVAVSLLITGSRLGEFVLALSVVLAYLSGIDYARRVFRVRSGW